MNPILIAAAVIPAFILLVRVYKADKLDREPTGLLVSLVLLGILSTVSALVLERIGSTVLSSFLTEDSVVYNILLYFIVVGFSEEGSKYLLLKLRTWKHKAFNCQFDGVVYAVFVSLGFALWENLGYVAMLGLSGAILRALTAVPGHACFGVFMGIFYGAAKRAEIAGQTETCKRMRRLSLLLPVFIHGMYDFITTLPGALSFLLFLPFIGCMFFVGYRMVKQKSAQDSFIVQPENPFDTQPTYPTSVPYQPYGTQPQQTSGSAAPYQPYGTQPWQSSGATASPSQPYGAQPWQTTGSVAAPSQPYGAQPWQTTGSSAAPGQPASAQPWQQTGSTASTGHPASTQPWQPTGSAAAPQSSDPSGDPNQNTSPGYQSVFDSKDLK